MSNGPPGAVKPLAQALARLLGTHAGARALVVAKRATDRGRDFLAGRGIRPPAPRQAVPTSPAAVRRIGIWEAKDGPEGREWVRIPRTAWQQWADVPRIGPKRARRVVLFGESVARGYFYDPEHNVAKALQRALDALPGAGPIEVIDLAVTDLKLPLLLQLARDAMALEPDALVFFAGNNWAASAFLERGDYTRMADEIRGGIHRVRDLIEHRLEERVSRFTQRVAELGREHRVPVVIIVPEFNLLDWRSDAGRQLAWLDEGRNQRWLDARVSAEAALAKGDLDGAERSAAEMMELDHGVSSVSPALLARARLARGDTAEARRLLEVSKDAELWTWIPTTPRCLAVTQRTLRAQAARHGVSIVDLPKLFSEHLGGGIPDRRLFHDYCHLTAEGIAVTARSTALALAPLLGVPVPADGLAGVDLLPSARVVAEANFTAAIHNANWGQPYDVILQHCVQALAASPDVADTMAYFLDFRVRRLPPALSTSFTALAGAGNQASARYLGGEVNAPRTFSSELTRAVAESLEPSRPGVTARLARLVVDEHAVERGPVDLLSPTYACDCFGELHRDNDLAFYRAYGQRSRFFLVVDRPERPAELEVTLRIPALSAHASVLVLANGKQVGTAAVSRTWARTTVRVPAAALQPGVNRIELEWPRGVHDHGKLGYLADTLQEGRVPDFLVSFGEVHSLTAKLQPARA